MKQFATSIVTVRGTSITSTLSIGEFNSEIEARGFYREKYESMGYKLPKYDLVIVAIEIPEKENQ